MLGSVMAHCNRVCVYGFSDCGQSSSCKHVFVFISGELTFSFWEIAINLLQEDDFKVKDTVADIVCELTVDVGSEFE